MTATPPASVIDLRAYATGAPPTRDWLTGRAPPAFADNGASVSAMAPVGQGGVDALPGDEFVILLSGELPIDSARGATVVTAARSAVLPAALSFSWRAT